MSLFVVLSDQGTIFYSCVSFPGSFMIAILIPISKCFRAPVHNYKVEVNHYMGKRATLQPLHVYVHGDQKKIFLCWDLNPRPPLLDVDTVTTGTVAYTVTTSGIHAGPSFGAILPYEVVKAFILILRCSEKTTLKQTSFAKFLPGHLHIPR